MATGITRAVCTVGCALLATGCYSGWRGDLPAGEGADGASGVDDGADDGAGDDDGGSPANRTSDDPPVTAAEVPMVGLRRLTAAEYYATVVDLVHAESLPAFELLPIDARTPFDNDYREQAISDALINAADYLAEYVAVDLVGDPARLHDVVGCAPTGPDDVECMRGFIERFGRRALRRPLSDAEIQTFLYGVNGDDGAIPFAIEEGDFDTGVAFVVRVLLQEPEFLYRVEIGEPVEGEPGLVRLGPYEVASRLSFLLWGTGPDEELLDLSAAGLLATPEQRREAATRLLHDPPARARIERFHAQWLGYETLPHGGALADSMRAETSALIEKVVFEDDAPWQDLLRATETWVDDTLAEHYGLVPSGSGGPAWTPYGDSGRRGLLSHGTYLSVGSKGDDTSPVQRGLAVQTRLLCRDIPPPPPGVDVDEEPTSETGFCKTDRYAAHSEGGCAGCHALLDPVGFGLEQYDAMGRFRWFESDDPDTPEDESTCAITGEGDLLGVGAFSGPGELAERALDSGELGRCLITQMHRYTFGRSELESPGADATLIDHAATALGDGDFALEALLMEVVGDPSFGYRRYDTEVK